MSRAGSQILFFTTDKKKEKKNCLPVVEYKRFTVRQYPQQVIHNVTHFLLGLGDCSRIQKPREKDPRQRPIQHREVHDVTENPYIINTVNSSKRIATDNKNTYIKLLIMKNGREKC